MTKSKAKKILGKIATTLEDKELQKIIMSLSALADVFVEQNRHLFANTKK